MSAESRSSRVSFSRLGGVCGNAGWSARAQLGCRKPWRWAREKIEGRCRGMRLSNLIRSSMAGLQHSSGRAITCAQRGSRGNQTTRLRIGRRVACRGTCGSVERRGVRQRREAYVGTGADAILVGCGSLHKRSRLLGGRLLRHNARHGQHGSRCCSTPAPESAFCCAAWAAADCVMCVRSRFRAAAL